MRFSSITIIIIIIIIKRSIVPKCSQSESRVWNNLYTHKIQNVPGVKVNTSGFNPRADSESKTSYTHGSNSQRFRSYEFLKYSK